MKKTFKGFTLVELLVVMAIIAVLIGISVAGLGFAMRRSRNISRQAAMSNLDRALEAYYSDYQRYPDDAAPADISDMISNTDYLYEYLEGSWDAPPQTEVYYESDEVLYTVCVSQEESLGEVSYVCTGPGIGSTDRGFVNTRTLEDCTNCLGICNEFEPEGGAELSWGECGG